MENKRDKIVKELRDIWAMYEECMRKCEEALAS